MNENLTQSLKLIEIFKGKYIFFSQGNRFSLYI